jgi:hypothetical protein
LARYQSCIRIDRTFAGKADTSRRIPAGHSRLYHWSHRRHAELAQNPPFQQNHQALNRAAGSQKDDSSAPELGGKNEVLKQLD